MRGRSWRRKIGLSLALTSLWTSSVLYGEACKHAPPNLSPRGKAAWYGMRVIKNLDLLRDTAISANAQTPPLLSEATTRKIVIAHRSAITVVHAAPNGWEDAVKVSLNEVLKDLPPNERAVVAPYVQLVLTVLQEVP